MNNMQVQSFTEQANFTERGHSAAPDAEYARIALPVGKRVELVAVAEIDYLHAQRNYVSLYIGQREYVLRSTMSELQERLPQSLFFRAHRSYLVRVGAIRHLQLERSGRVKLRLSSDAEVFSCRTQRGALLARLGLKHAWRTKLSA